MTQEGNTLRVKIKRTNDEVATKDGTRCSLLYLKCCSFRFEASLASGDGVILLAGASAP